jgi:hypothetical protein
MKHIVFFIVLCVVLLAIVLFFAPPSVGSSGRSLHDAALSLTL